MARNFKEVARFRGNDKAYEDNWDRIFGPKRKAHDEELEEYCDCDDCNARRETDLANSEQ